MDWLFSLPKSDVVYGSVGTFDEDDVTYPCWRCHGWYPWYNFYSTSRQRLIEDRTKGRIVCCKDCKIEMSVKNVQWSTL